MLSRIKETLIIILQFFERKFELCSSNLQDETLRAIYKLYIIGFYMCLVSANRGYLKIGPCIP